MKTAANVAAGYAKFITSLSGLLVTYLQMYGATWHLVPAVTAIGAALAVLGVPNAQSVVPLLGSIRNPIPVEAKPPATQPPAWPAGRAPGTQ